MNAEIYILLYKMLPTDIRPLDMIFFRGGEIVSKLIGVMERFTVGSGEWTHVGIVVNDALLPDYKLDPGCLYIWESTFSSKYLGGDIGILGTEGGYFGTQLRKLDQVIPAYLEKRGTKIAWAKLARNPWADETNRSSIIKKFSKLFKLYNNVRYDYNPVSLLGSMVKPLRQDNDKLFCSELVALIYVKLGILPNTVVPSSVIPMDFFGIDADHMVPCCVESLTNLGKNKLKK
jgi:hypothetical protein